MPGAVRTSRPGRGLLVTPFALAIVLTVGAFVRLRGVNALGLTSDEAVYAGQAAKLAGNAAQMAPSPTFRAHPLLFQALLSLFYRVDVSDLTGRLLSVGFGVALIFLVFLLGRILYGSAVGLAAATLIAFMPYAVVASRQILLDGPMATFVTLALFLTVRYSYCGRRVDLVAAGATLGVAFLAKETAILFFFSLLFIVGVRARLGAVARDLLAAVLSFGIVASVYPLTVLLGGAGTTSGDYLQWQISRQGNHSWEYYATTVIPSLGVLAVASAVAGLLLQRRSWREPLLLIWVVPAAAFFEFWPVKGFQYMLPLAPVIAVLAARGLVRGTAAIMGRSRPGAVSAVATSLVLLAAADSVTWTWPGSGTDGGVYQTGFPAGREAGTWLSHNAAVSSEIITAASSTANVVAFYARRKTLALSVSTAADQHNPAYEPVGNADAAIRGGRVRYLVWDAYADASVSPSYNLELMRLVESYSGRAVHTESAPTHAPDGRRLETPVIVIYEVHP